MRIIPATPFRPAVTPYRLSPGKCFSTDRFLMLQYAQFSSLSSTLNHR